MLLKLYLKDCNLNLTSCRSFCKFLSKQKILTVLSLSGNNLTNSFVLSSLECFPMNFLRELFIYNCSLSSDQETSLGNIKEAETFK